jgi:hypothetical protein
MSQPSWGYTNLRYWRIVTALDLVKGMCHEQHEEVRVRHAICGGYQCVDRQTLTGRFRS